MWCGWVWRGVAACSVVWLGVVWCGCDVVWCGWGWCGVVWCGVVCVMLQGFWRRMEDFLHGSAFDYSTS